MQRSFGAFLIITLLIIGLGVGEIAWTRLQAPGCQEWQAELQRRVDAYARLHLPEPAPQVQVQAVCGLNSLPDALYFRWQTLSWRMGWRDQKPLDEADLRMAATRDLMQHPDMGTLKFTVRFDPSLASDTRKRVEELITRYLLVDDVRQKLEFRRLKKSVDNSAVKGTVQTQEPPVLSRPWRPALLETTEPHLRAALIRACNFIFMLMLIQFAAIFLLMSWRSRRPRRARPVAKTSATPAVESSFHAILFAPRVAVDFGERGRELWPLLIQLDEQRAVRLVLHWWEKDRGGLIPFLGFLTPDIQEMILRYLSTDQLLQLTEGHAVQSPRDSQRAALRILLDIARELAACSSLTGAPLFLHLMTRREWQRVAQQMTRPRRRALSELLDKERAGWLRARQDLHPGWFQTGAKEDMNADQLVRRVRSVLQVDADQLREQLYADREAVQVIDSYFADLTLDAGLNNDLAMLVLGECLHRQSGFWRLVERRDPTLLAALDHLDDQQIALLLHETDPLLKTQLYTVLGSRQTTISALVEGSDLEKHLSKSRRMQARSLQRFVERQVLVAELLCTSAS